MSTLSLQKSVRTCSVNTGEAERIQSDRFLNPGNMVCIPWNGLNNKGQEVSPDSFYTKSEGCDSALDRVAVENSQRPKYFNYVTLNAQGVNGEFYGGPYANTIKRDQFDKERSTITGGFGYVNQLGADVQYTGCSVGAYERGQAEIAQANRQMAFANNANTAENYRHSY
jgi:hypothetical protein